MRFLWAVWFSLLVATPYYVQDPYAGSLQSGMYAYVALGLLVGAGLSGSFPASERPVLARRVTLCLAVAGPLVSLAFLASEWVGLPVYLGGNQEEIFAPLVRRLMDYEHIGVFAGSVACAFLGVQLADPVSAASGALGHKQRITHPPVRSAWLYIWGFFAPIALFLVGLFRVVASAPFLPHMVRPASTMEVFTGLPPAFVAVPLLVSFVFSLAIMRAARAVGDACVFDGCGRKMYGAILITALALGMLCWNMLTRVVAVAGTAVLDQWGLIVLAQIGIIAAGALSFWLVGAKQTSGRGEDLFEGALPVHRQTDGEDRRSEARQALLAGHGLTEREQRAAALMIDGLTSAESAEIMGIGPSTVRGYLQRAYKKLGVASGEELGRSLQMRPIPGNVPEPEPGLAASKRHRRVSKAPVALMVVALGGMLGVVATLLIPHFVAYQAWGMGREVLVGGGSALIVAGAGGRYLSWAIGQNMVKPDRIGRQARLVWRSVLGAAVVGSGLTVLFFLSQTSLGEYRESFSSDFIFTGASFVFAAGWLFGAARGLSVLGQCAAKAQTVALASVLVAAAVFFLSLFSRELWLACAAVALLSLVGMCALPTQSQEPKKHDQSRYGRHFGRIGAGVFFALGFASEELWRSLGTFSLAVALLPFLAMVILGGVGFFLRSAPQVRVASWVSVLVVLVGFVAGQGYGALFLGAVFQMLLLAGYGVCRQVLSVRYLFLWGMGAGFGCLAGVILVDFYSDFLLLGDVLLSVFGGKLAVSERVFVFAGMVFTALGILALQFCKKLHDEVQMQGLSKSWGDQIDERIRHYLLGAGLNETQARVVAEVAYGSSSSEISEKLNYARGTVNSARDTSYRLLNVRSRAQLIALLQKDAGM